MPHSYSSVSSGSAHCFLGRPSVPADTLGLISGRVTQSPHISFVLGSTFHLPSLPVLFKASAALDGISGVVWVCPACSDRPLAGKATPGLKVPGRPLTWCEKLSLTQFFSVLWCSTESYSDENQLRNRYLLNTRCVQNRP